jgi:hypothetical protein
MSKLYKAVTTLLVTVVATWGITVQAQNDGAKGAPVEYWSCTWKKGKDMGDMDKAIEKFNEWRESHSSNYNAWVLTPMYFDPSVNMDVAWLGGWQDGADYGKYQDAWHNEGQEVFQGFMKVVDCDGHQMATSLTLNAQDAPPKDGLVMFSRCEVAEGKTVMDAVNAHQGLTDSYKGSNGPTVNSWLFFPGAGSGPDVSLDYWTVLGFPTYADFGAAWEGYTNGGGWEKFMTALGGTTQCAAGTGFNARHVSGG